MKTLLTDQAIRRFKVPPTGRLEITDAHPDVKGFTLRLTAGGVRTFNMVYRSPTDGKQARIAIGTYPATTLAEAREKAKRYRGLVEGGTDPRDFENAERARRRAEKEAKAQEADGRTRGMVATVAQAFILMCRDRRGLRQWREYERQLQRHVLSFWPDRHVSEITSADCRALHQHIEDKAGPVAANRALACVSSMFSWLVKGGHKGVEVAVNPASRIKSDVPETTRDRVLPDAELAAVWHAAEGLQAVHRAFVRTLILTGQRRSEVAQMRWCDVDTDAALWTLPREHMKMSKAHTVPLSGLALAQLAGVPRIGGEHVFTTDGRTRLKGFGKLKAALDAAIAGNGDADEAAPVAPWVFHDLRRTLATGMQRLGVEVHIVEKVLAHESGTFSGIVGVYQRHGYDREKRQALEAWANHVAAITDRTGTVVPLVRQR